MAQADKTLPPSLPKEVLRFSGRSNTGTDTRRYTHVVTRCYFKPATEKNSEVHEPFSYFRLDMVKCLLHTMTEAYTFLILVILKIVSVPALETLKPK